jgi:hypothetical protein
MNMGVYTQPSMKQWAKVVYCGMTQAYTCRHGTRDNATLRHCFRTVSNENSSLILVSRLLLTQGPHISKFRPQFN